MRSPDLEKYVKDILSHVKFKYDHNDIYFEIMEHMEDLYDDLVNEGIDENEAIKLTVEYMGDSEEIGKALNKEHNPFVGWIYRILKYCIILLVILNIIPVFTLVASIFLSIHSFFWINGNIEEEGKNIAITQEIDETRKIDSTYVFFDGFKNRANREKTAFEIEKLKLEKEKRLADLKKEYDKSFQTFEAYSEELNIKKDLLNTVKDKLSAVDRLTANKLADNNELLAVKAELLTQEYELEQNIINISSKIEETEN